MTTLIPSFSATTDRLIPSVNTSSQAFTLNSLLYLRFILNTPLFSYYIFTVRRVHFYCTTFQLFTFHASLFTRPLVSSPELRRQSTSVKQPLRYPSVRPTACLRVAAKPSRPALRSAKASGCPAAAVAASATGGAPLRASPQGEAWAGRIPVSAQESLATLYRSTSPLRFTSTAFSACATGSAPEPFADSTKASPGGEVAREARRRGVPVRLPQALWPCGRLIAAPTAGTGVWWMCRGRCLHRPEPAADGSVRRKHSGGAGWFASGGALFTAAKCRKRAEGCGTAETPLRQACGLPPPLKGRLGPIRLQGFPQRPHGLPRNVG